MGAIIIDGPTKSDIRIGSKSNRTVDIARDKPDLKARWGEITGDIENQTDLKEKLDELRILAYAGL